MGRVSPATAMRASTAGAARPSRAFLRARQLVAPLLTATLAASATGDPVAARPGSTPMAVEIRRLLDAGCHDDATAMARAGLRETASRFGRDTLEAARAIDLVVMGLYAAGETQGPEALELARQAVAIKEAAPGSDDRELAVSLQNLGVVHRFRGDPWAAEAILDRALATFARAGDELGSARARADLAHALANQGRPEESLQLLRRSLDIRERLLDPGSPEIAQSLMGVASALVDLSRPAEARPLLERAIDILARSGRGQGLEMARVRESLGDLLYRSDDVHGAAAAFDEVLAIRSAILPPDHPDVGAALSNVAALRSDLGRFSEARPLFERSLAIKEARLLADDILFANTLSSYASALAEAGALADARGRFERARNILERNGATSTYDYSAVVNNIGALAFLEGDFARAQSAFETTYAILERVVGADNPSLAFPEGNVAVCFLEMGDFGRARARLERAIALARGHDDTEDPAGVAIWTVTLGELLSRMGELEKAEATLREGLDLTLAALGPDTAEAAVALANIGQVLQSLGRAAEAETYLLRALEASRRSAGPEHPLVASALNGLGSLQMRLGRLDEARRSCEEAVAIWERMLGPDHPSLARGRRDLALVLALSGDDDAFSESLEAERIGRSDVRLTARFLGERQALRYLATRVDALPLVLALGCERRDGARATAAHDALVRSRAIVLDEMAARRRELATARDGSDPLQAAVVRASQRLANLLVRGAEQDPPAIYRARIEDAREEKDAAERRLAEVRGILRDDSEQSQAGLSEVSAALPPSSALVSFARIDVGDVALLPARVEDARVAPMADSRTPTYVAFVMRAGERASRAVPLGSAATLEGAIGTWRRHVVLPDDVDAVRRAGLALRELAWDPLLEHVGDAETVFVVPDGALHLVSFAALPIDATRHVVETGPLVHQLSAERDVVTLASAAPRGRGLLALGAAAFNERGAAAAESVVRGSRSACADFASLRFGDLPSTAAEARDVAERWRRHASGSRSPAEGADDAVLLLGPEATETAFKIRAPGSRVVHVATHGFFLGSACPAAGAAAGQRPASADALLAENPLVLSGLALSGANLRESAGDGEDDGILTAEEVAALELGSVESAVLAACDTGRGELRAGEGVLGLRRAFRIAGAGSTILSLWRVEDASTGRWMRAFYESRLDWGAGMAESVRAASLAVLRERRERRESTHPFYWAAFVASGDWR